ncbi:hypothetical protein EJ03DRAFT_150498 [Teratosphaeria nubilosa]|uniref:Uncharacterized protein n=1 Tax=Teratosphaeria nubilosa TaxID=161662 RepID=A0A6G1LJ54_9PEZI|nr:hypothetical protein EJ03DRAFT_150498 [Teratosphaeria nubilosa]
MTIKRSLARWRAAVRGVLRLAGIGPSIRPSHARQNYHCVPLKARSTLRWENSSGPQAGVKECIYASCLPYRTCFVGSVVMQTDRQTDRVRG